MPLPAYSTLSEERLSVVRRYELPFGQLQTCRWRDEHVFACAGGSNALALVDSGGIGAVARGVLGSAAVGGVS